MRANRRDANHAEIRDGLRKCGYVVFDVADSKVIHTDLLVLSKGNMPVLIEIKMPGEKLTDKEEKFWQEYKGALEIAYSLEDAIKVMEYWDCVVVTQKERK